MPSSDPLRIHRPSGLKHGRSGSAWHTAPWNCRATSSCADVKVTRRDPRGAAASDSGGIRWSRSHEIS